MYEKCVCMCVGVYVVFLCEYDNGPTRSLSWLNSTAVRLDEGTTSKYLQQLLGDGERKEWSKQDKSSMGKHLSQYEIDTQRIVTF